MIRNGEITMSEVKRVVRKYWWIFPITVVGGVGLALGATTFLPKKFTSTTLVLIDQQTVSPTMLPPVITEGTNQRLASIQEQILSRSRLQPMIERFGLYPADRNTAHMEDLVTRLRTAIDISPLEPMQGSATRQMPGFHVNVTFDNPQTAQRICSEITTMFMEQNSKNLDDKSNQATEFFTQQADEAKRKLDEQDRILAEFKTKYMGSLPDNEQMNLGMLTGMNTQLDALTQAISRAQQDKAMNESLLASQLATREQYERGSGTASPETVDTQLNNLQDQLTALESRYTPDHPDVIKTRNQIEQLKLRMAAAPKVTTPNKPQPANGIEPPAIQQLRAKLKQDDISIADLSKRQNQLQGQINSIQGRIQSTPAVEQQYKELTRNYQSAMESYNDLLKKRDQAHISGEMNHQQEGEQFRVLDPPSLPMSPSFPKKSIFAGAGFGGGLAIALGLLYLLAAMDFSMHTERDVEVCMKLPVLAMVPNVAPASRAPVRSKDKTLGLAATQV